MFPPFVDGLSPTAPPESLEPARDAPVQNEQESFETHLQRTREFSKAETADGNPHANDDRAAVNASQSGAQEADQEADQEAPNDSLDEDAHALHEEPAHDQESTGRAAEPADELSTGNVEVPSNTTPPETLGEAGKVVPAVVDATSPEQVARGVSDTDGLDQTELAEPRRDPPSIPRAAAPEPERREVANPADAEQGEQIAVTTEPLEPDAHPAGGEALAATAAPLDAAGKSRTAAISAKNSDHAEILSGTAAETAAAGKQVSTGGESIAGALSSEPAPNLEDAAEAEKSAPRSAAADGNPETAATSPRDRFAQQLTTGGGERGSRAAATGDINQTRFVDRVARAFRASEGQGGTIKLRLHPPELGMLQVQLRVQGNALTAKLEAETPAARALLVDSLPVLRERLAEQGVRIEQFDVDLMERHPQNLPDGTGERPAGEQNADGPSPVEASNDETISDEPLRAVDGDNQQLNIIV